NSRDEALALPTEEAARLALRTQQVIAHESGVTDTVDPLAGSYFVESLTDEIEQRVWEYIREIDAMGGAIAAIEKHYYQSHIAESAYKYQMAIEKKEKIIVGVNEFQVEEKVKPEILRIDENIRKRQIEALNKVKQTRDGKRVGDTLEKLKESAGSSQNVLPLILNSVEAYASVGEISDALRSVWGEYES
ncbi:MAG TPA: methylmalonyl-CoA mutase, partial [Bacteroidetes bacterium]|nr:methylmalonyl-CoA mutase [Bacteroidota bacterium]